MIVFESDSLQNYRRPTRHLSACLKAVLGFSMAITAAAQSSADAIDDAVQATERPAADRKRDANSRPAEILRFFGVPAGGVAVDLFAGGGYYSELLSRAMGEGAVVYMHNNAAYLGFTGDSVDQRLANERLPAVVRYDRELTAIDLADDSVDLILMVMTYHDLYYKTDGWDLDPAAFFATVQRILKPDGVLAIVDHVAATGSGSRDAQDLHRIDPEFAKKDIQSRGFRLVAESEVLRNPDDKLAVSVFDPSVRGRTSKFVYKFVPVRATQ